MITTIVLTVFLAQAPHGSQAAVPDVTVASPERQKALLAQIQARTQAPDTKARVAREKARIAEAKKATAAQNEARQQAREKAKLGYERAKLEFEKATAPERAKLQAEMMKAQQEFARFQLEAQQAQANSQAMNNIANAIERDSQRQAFESRLRSATINNALLGYGTPAFSPSAQLPGAIILPNGNVTYGQPAIASPAAAMDQWIRSNTP
jgi:hypothetical protein